MEKSEVDLPSKDSASVNGKTGRKMGLQHLKFVPDLILTVGIGLCWYTRWQYYNHTMFLVMGAVGLGTFIGHLLLSLYFRLNFMLAIGHLWYGCLLGIISLYDLSPNLQHQLNDLEEIGNLLLVSSAICQFTVELFCKCFTWNRNNAILRLWKSWEVFEIIGGCIACVLMGTHIGSLLTLMCAFVFLILTLKLGSFISLLNLAFLLMTTERYLFPDLNISTNPYGLICFVGRLSAGPVIELFISSKSRLERWQGFILSRRLYQRFCLLVVATVEVTFFMVHASAVKNHKEWYVVVPFFALLSVLWFVMHLVFIIVFGTLINRFVRCSENLGMVTGILSLKKMLAARGLRYFSLVAYRLMLVSLASSVLVALLCWTTRTPYSHALLCLVLGMETIVMELLQEFSSTLGGTCIGYGIVTPVAAVRSDGMITVLPPNFIQEAGNRSTKTLQSVVELFSQHMITNFGCDWRMAGESLDGLERKLQEFFSQTTLEGPRYDTYMLYYSGPTAPGGDWALMGNSSMTLENIVRVWEEKNGDSSSRLLLICDCEHSDQWLKPIWRLKSKRTFIGMQSVRFVGRKSDPEISSTTIGDFTRLWVDYNATGGNRAVFDPPSLQLMRPAYAISRYWTDFHFHLPTSEEIKTYWLQTLPRVTHPCMRFVVACLSAKLPGTCCDLCGRVFRRCRMKLWPPAELDTGHGFKLLRL